MINTIDRLGTEENHEGWFLLNNCVKVRYIDDPESPSKLKMDIQYDHKIVTEQEATELANELLHEVLKGNE